MRWRQGTMCRRELVDCAKRSDHHMESLAPRLRLRLQCGVSFGGAQAAAREQAAIVPVPAFKGAVALALALPAGADPGLTRRGGYAVLCRPSRTMARRRWLWSSERVALVHIGADQLHEVSPVNVGADDTSILSPS